MPASPALIRTAEGYGLTTAQIIYRVPDHRQFLQEFIWQEFDLFPDFPSLQKFLSFWAREIEGPLHSVRVAHALLVQPADLEVRDGVFRLH